MEPEAGALAGLGEKSAGEADTGEKGAAEKLTRTKRAAGKIARKKLADEKAAAVADTIGAAPINAGALNTWLIRTLDITIARRPLVEGHQAPFAYLVHSFFEGRKSWTSKRSSSAPADSVVWAGRGGGKTFLGAVATMLDLVFKKGIEVRILGGSLEQSRRMHAHLRAMFTRPELSYLVEGAITERRLKLTNGSSVELLAQSQVSVRGTRVHKLRCDEVELFNPEVWEAAQLTTRSDRIVVKGRGTFDVRGSVECFSTMHLAHGLMSKLVEDTEAGTRKLFRWGVVDVMARCPKKHACRVGDERGVEARRKLEAGEDEVARAGDCVLFQECRGRAKNLCRGHVTVDDAVGMKKRVSVPTWEAEMLCLRPSRASAVYGEFDPRVHVVDEAPPNGVEVVRWIAGMDFGYRAPTVVLWGAVDGAGVLWVVGEHAASGVVLADHVRAIGEAPWPRPQWIGVDPAGKQRNGQTGVRDSEVLRRAGFKVMDRGLKLLPGLELVRARLRPAAGESGPRLFVHRRCAVLIEALVKYHYDPSKPESVEPVKDGPDHAADALRYMVQSLDRPVRTVSGRYLG